MKKISYLMLLGLLSILLFTHCPQTEVTSARVYINRAEYDSAIEQCQIAIDKVPNNPTAYFEMGRAYGFKRMYREMNEAFTKSLQYGDTFAEDIENHRKKYWFDLFNAGVDAIKQEKLDKAIEDFNLAIQLVPENKDSYKNLAISYSQSDNDSMAIETFKIAQKVLPNDMEITYHLGLMYYQATQYQKAIDVLSQVIEADPKPEQYQDALYHMAYSYDLLGKGEEAKNLYIKVLTENPNDKDLRFNLARLNYTQEDYEEAIENFKKVLELDSTDAETNLNIGMAYQKLEKWSEAIPFIERSIELDPNNSQAWFYLGVSHVRSGNAKKGEEAFQKSDALKAAGGE